MAASSSLIAGVASSGMLHRYTGTSTTSRGASTARASANSGAPPSRCTTMRRPAIPSAVSRASTSALVSVGAVHATSNPAARAADCAFGPRATTRPAPRACLSSSPMPTLSAAPNHDRTPMPVVNTTTSTGAASTCLVAAMVASRSSSSVVDIVGPCTTRAPRRESISACSSQRRWPVMPIV